MQSIHPQKGNKFSIEVRVDYKKQEYVLTEEQYGILQNQGMLADMEEFLRKVNSSEVFKLYAERLAVYGPFFDGYSEKDCNYLMLSFCCLIGLPFSISLSNKRKEMRQYEKDGNPIVDSFSKQAEQYLKEIQERNLGFSFSYVQDKQLYSSGYSTHRPSRYPKSNRQIIFVIRNFDPEMEHQIMEANKQETELERRLRMANEQDQYKQNY